MRVDEHTITLDSSPVFYRSASADGAPTLYLHGVPTSSDDWIGLLERTGGIAPDLIGFGRSGKGGHLDYSIAGLATFLEWFLDELGVGEVKVVGHSWGAAVGLVFANRHPQRVAKIALHDPLPMIDGFRWPAVARVWRRRLLGELAMGATTRRVLARELRRGAQKPLEVWPTERVAAVWSHFDQGTQRAVLRLHRYLDERALAKAGEELRGLLSPVLIVWGEQDPWFPAKLAAPLTALFRSAESKIVPDAGHWPWLESQSAIDAVEDFMR